MSVSEGFGDPAPVEKRDTPRESDGRVWCDLTIPIEDVARFALRALPVLAGLVFAPYLIVWGGPDLSWIVRPSAWGGALWRVFLFTGIYLVSVFVHEGLHAAAMIGLGRIPPRALRFGVDWRLGIAYVHTGRPMTARAYRGVLALPALVQGVVPVGAGWADGSGWLTVYGFVMLVSAIGDVAVLWRIRGLGSGVPVRDHPHQVGCQARVDPSG